MSNDNSVNQGAGPSNPQRNEQNLVLTEEQALNYLKNMAESGASGNNLILVEPHRRQLNDRPLHSTPTNWSYVEAGDSTQGENSVLVQGNYDALLGDRCFPGIDDQMTSPIQPMYPPRFPRENMELWQEALGNQNVEIDFARAARRTMEEVNFPEMPAPTPREELMQEQQDFLREINHFSKIVMKDFVKVMKADMPKYMYTVINKMMRAHFDQTKIDRVMAKVIFDIGIHVLFHSVRNAVNNYVDRVFTDPIVDELLPNMGLGQVACANPCKCELHRVKMALKVEEEANAGLPRWMTSWVPSSRIPETDAFERVGRTVMISSRQRSRSAGAALGVKDDDC